MKTRALLIVLMIVNCCLTGSYAQSEKKPVISLMVWMKKPGKEAVQQNLFYIRLAHLNPIYPYILKPAELPGMVMITGSGKMS